MGLSKSASCDYGSQVESCFWEQGTTFSTFYCFGPGLGYYQYLFGLMRLLSHCDYWEQSKNFLVLHEVLSLYACCRSGKIHSHPPFFGTNAGLRVLSRDLRRNLKAPYYFAIEFPLSFAKKQQILLTKKIHFLLYCHYFCQLYCCSFLQYLVLTQYYRWLFGSADLFYYDFASDSKFFDSSTASHLIFVNFYFAGHLQNYHYSHRIAMFSVSFAFG